MSGQDHCADLRDFAHLVMRASSLEERSELACAMRRRAAQVERQSAAPARPVPAPEHRTARSGTVMVGARPVSVEVRGRRGGRLTPYI